MTDSCQMILLNCLHKHQIMEWLITSSNTRSSRELQVWHYYHPINLNSMCIFHEQIARSNGIIIYFPPHVCNDNNPRPACSDHNFWSPLVHNVVSGYKMVQIWGNGQIIGSHRQTNGKMARCLLLIIIAAFVCVVSSNHGIKRLYL